MKNTFRKVSSVQLQYCTVNTSIIFRVYTNLHTNFKGLYPFLKQLEREELGSLDRAGRVYGEEKERGCRGGWRAPGEFQLAYVLPFPAFLSPS